MSYLIEVMTDRLEATGEKKWLRDSNGKWSLIEMPRNLEIRLLKKE